MALLTENHSLATKRWIDWQLDKFFELSFMQSYGQQNEGVYSGGCRYWWEDLYTHWLQEPSDEAAQDIIVRVANDQIMQSSLWAITYNPTCQLVRSRELVEASKVQELDTSCLRWLSQKPGETLLQKAALSRRLLALRRTHSYDNLENRVFIYVLNRLIHRAKSYLDHNASYRTSIRYKQVDALLSKLNRMKAITPCVVKTPLVPSLSTTPNNCLLYDHNYSLLWSLFRHLLMIEQIREAAQQYQQTLWKETGRQLFGALLCSPGSPLQCSARSCVYFKSDMQDGRWSQQPNPPGPFTWNKKTVLIFDAWEENLPEPQASLLQELNADQLLVLRKGHRNELTLAIWYHHHLFDTSYEKDVMIKACRESLLDSNGTTQSSIRGLIFASTTPGSDVSSYILEDARRLTLFTLPIAPLPSYDRLRDTILLNLSHILATV